MPGHRAYELAPRSAALQAWPNGQADGHPQRYPRQLLRRRPLRCRAGSAGTGPAACWPRGPTSSTSAARARDPAPTRSRPPTSWLGSCRRSPRCALTVSWRQSRSTPTRPRWPSGPSPPEPPSSTTSTACSASPSWLQWRPPRGAPLVLMHWDKARDAARDVMAELVRYFEVTLRHRRRGGRPSLTTSCSTRVSASPSRSARTTRSCAGCPSSWPWAFPCWSALRASR
jgi:hypothetical protein